MNKYMYLYIGGVSQEEINIDSDEVQAEMAKWEKYGQKLGDNLVDFGNPFGERIRVSSNGQKDVIIDEHSSSGYGIVQAKDLDEAVALTEGHPHLESGSIEVLEIFDISG